MGVYVEPKSRCCRSYLECSFLTRDALQSLSRIKTSNLFSKTKITKLIKNIRNLMQTANRLTFDIPSLLSDDSYFDLTGLTKAQFADLCNEVPNLKQSNVRSVCITVAIFLTKMRTGLSNKLLSVIFDFKKNHIQRAITSCRISLMKKLDPKNLGFVHILHNNFVENYTSTVASSLSNVHRMQMRPYLFWTVPINIFKKSMVYLFQRKSYSIHKNRPLVKPMMVVGSDGYILLLFGPYYANGKKQ